MTRMILNEHLVDRFIIGLFNAVLKKKQKIIQKAIDVDPEMQRIIADIEKSRQELERLIRQSNDGDITPFLIGLD